MLTYRPEGLQSLPIPTPESLRRAGGSREIFQAMCIKCDEFHNLVVDLGNLRGLIPREERSHFTCIACCSFQIMSHNNHISVITHHHNGIFQSLPLG